MNTLINGKPGDRISVQDRGLSFGDGVFETIAAKNGKLLCADLHFQRLVQGCGKLKIRCPDISVIAAESAKLCSDGTGVLKVIVTRGNSVRGYTPDPDAEPNRIISFSPPPRYPEECYKLGIEAIICRQRLVSFPELAGVKHLNRIDNVLAAMEVAESNVREGLMLDQEDNLVEGTRTNVFLVFGEELHTPDLNQCGIAGVMRHMVIEHARKLGFKVVCRSVKRNELAAADELFVCNSLIGVWPLQSLDKQSLQKMEIGHMMQAEVSGISLGGY